MSYQPTPAEEARLAALRRYALLDTPPEAAFDRLASLAARLFCTPLCLMALLDHDRHWFKSCQGPGSDDLHLTEVRRDLAFCAHAVLSPETLVVEDARQDPRFADNPFVTGPPGIRFYAGAPLIGPEGHTLGALCLIDFQPRTFSAEQQAALADLAAAVVSEMELRRVAADLADSARLYRQMFEDSPQAMWVFDADTHRFLAVNDSALAHYGYERAEFLSLSLADIQLDGQGTRLCRHRTKEGTLLWTETASHAVEYEGRAARLVVAQDVTERVQAEDALRRSEQKLSLHVQQTPLAFMEWNLDAQITAWNPAAEHIFGYSREEVLGRAMIPVLVPEKTCAHVEAVGRAIVAHRGGERSTNENVTKDGRVILCEWYNTPLVDDQGKVIGVASLAQDITERERAEAALRLSEARKSAIVEAALDCIISIDHRRQVIEWNPAAERTFGYRRDEALGRELADLIIPPDAREAHRRGVAHYLATGEGPILGRRIEVMAQRKDGSAVVVELTTTAIQTGAEPAFTAYLRDITEHRALEADREALLAQTEGLLAEALENADQDPLTGLINHRVFHHRLEAEIESAQRRGLPLALLMMDLDNFKFFNDAYGHIAGDDVLRRVAQAMLSCCRAGDTLARFGGDEFALLIPGAGRAEAERLAERLRVAVLGVGYQPPGYDTPIPLSLSVGAACAPEDGMGRVALLEAADAALRLAKSGGGDGGEAMRLRRTMARSVGGFSMLDALVTAVDNKDRYTRKHSEDVLAYSLQIARSLGLDGKTQHMVEVAALLHDVGKIGVPDAILRKPGRLSDEEFQAIQQHPLMGAVIVGAVPGFEDALDAVRHHHERWDGEGYPFGLRGEETPLMARLMAVADAYSAMTTDRPYRKGMEPTKARRILGEGAGTQWDPACVAAFLQVDSA